MRETGKISSNGFLIKEGDFVLKNWGIQVIGGVMEYVYRYHQITVKPAHMMANGEMHDDGGGIIFCLGNSYNFWEGCDVMYMTNETVEAFKALGFEPAVEFTIRRNSNGECVPYPLTNIF